MFTIIIRAILVGIIQVAFSLGIWALLMRATDHLDKQDSAENN